MVLFEHVPAQKSFSPVLQPTALLVRPIKPHLV